MVFLTGGTPPPTAQGGLFMNKVYIPEGYRPPLGTFDTTARVIHTRGLIASIPDVNVAAETLYAIPGNVPMLSDLPSGCPFNPRCPHAKDVCRCKRPPMEPANGDENHVVACWMFSEDWGE